MEFGLIRRFTSWYSKRNDEGELQDESFIPAEAVKKGRDSLSDSLRVAVKSASTEPDDMTKPTLVNPYRPSGSKVFDLQHIEPGQPFLLELVEQCAVRVRDHDVVLVEDLRQGVHLGIDEPIRYSDAFKRVPLGPIHTPEPL